MQVKFEFKTSKNYKQKLQATIASKIWIQNKANNEATKPKSKSSFFLIFFFWPNQPMTQPSAGNKNEIALVVSPEEPWKFYSTTIWLTNVLSSCILASCWTSPTSLSLTEGEDVLAPGWEAEAEPAQLLDASEALEKRSSSGWWWPPPPTESRRVCSIHH